MTATPIIIEPPRGVHLHLRDVWRSRDLLRFFVWRDIKVRYKQTIVGGAWAIVQPLFAMVVFSVIFGAFAGLPSDGLPYPIFAYTAALLWMYFASALTGASNSVVDQAGLLSKVYFPRLLLPVAGTLGGLVDFAVASIVLVGLMAYFGVVPGLAILLVPVFLLLALLTALSVGILLAALNAMYRDVRYALPFLLQFWMYASPVAYSASIVPEKWKLLYGLNPMVGIIEGFRWAVLGTTAPAPALLAVSVATILVLLLPSIYYFRRMEGYFADRV